MARMVNSLGRSCCVSSSIKSIFILSAALVLAQSSNQQADSIASALQNKEFTKALDLLAPALRQSPADARLWAMQGTAYAEEGRSKEALASFRTSLKSAPDYLPALQGAAQIEYAAGNAAAIPLIEHVLRLRPDDATSHAMLAVLLYQRDNCAAALPHFEKSGALLDSHPEDLHAHAICLVKLKRFDRAVEVLEHVVALNPTDPRERQLLASAQLMAHRPTDALATLDPLLKSSDPSAGTLELASGAYEDAKDTSQAVAMLRDAILLDPENEDFYLDFANISYNHGSFQAGVDVISDGLVLQPRSAPLHFSRGVLYVQLGQFDKAEADFEKAYELDPIQSLGVAAQGLVAAQGNDYDRALRKVKTSLARTPSDPLALYLQADILAAKNADPNTPEFQLAVRSAQKAVALQPALGAARGVLAKLYLKQGKYSDAVRESRKALAINPTDQKVVYYLIQSLRKTGDQDEIPQLLKRLATLREEAIRKDKERYRYKLED